MLHRGLKITSPDVSFCAKSSSAKKNDVCFFAYSNPSASCFLGSAFRFLVLLVRSRYIYSQQKPTPSGNRNPESGFLCHIHHTSSPARTGSVALAPLVRKRPQFRASRTHSFAQTLIWREQTYTFYNLMCVQVV